MKCKFCFIDFGTAIDETENEIDLKRQELVLKVASTVVSSTASDVNITYSFIITSVDYTNPLSLLIILENSNYNW